MKELIIIQTKLSVPKAQRNTFGGFNYRSAEDILESVKPLLKETECFLNITDSIELVGDRYYIKATATITNKEGVKVSSSAFAREELTQKGKDASQITGSTSSYARKYALNGLFAIDDNKDADTDEFKKQQDKLAKEVDKDDNVRFSMGSGKPKKTTTKKATTKPKDIIPDEVKKEIEGCMTLEGLKEIQEKYAILDLSDLLNGRYKQLKNK